MAWIDFNPMHSPVAQWVSSHLLTAAAGYVISNPSVIAGAVASHVDPTLAPSVASLITAALGALAAWLANHSFGTALNTMPPGLPAAPATADGLPELPPVSGPVVKP